MELSSSAMMAVTDPDGRSAGQTPLAAVNQIPKTILTAPQEEPQFIDILSPKAGEWEVGIVARGEGGSFRLAMATVVGTKTTSRAVVGSIRPGQRLVTLIRLDDSGQADGFGPLQQTTETRARLALPQHGATTAALPRAKLFALVVGQIPLGCGSL
jgi:hypothetical protein